MSPFSLVSATAGNIGGMRRAGHLWELDIVRLLAFSAVISVHALAFTQSPSNVAAAGAMMLLQFGREVFFSITGFVLVYSTLGKKVETWPFWRRRIPFVAVPYVVWSVVYYVLGLTTAPGGPWSWSTLGRDLLYGGAEYHLYFLIVTLQLYLVFPLLVRFVRRTAGHAVAVLIAAGVANLVWLGLLQYTQVKSGPAAWLWVHGYEILPTYTIYVLAGCYGALHVDALRAALVAHRRRAVGIAAAGVAVALGTYAVQLRTMAPRMANVVTQPAMLASCVAATIAVCLVAEWWVGTGLRGRKGIEVASEISFGVYLSHPLILTFLLDHGLGNGQQVIPPLLATVAAFAGAVTGAVLLCLAIRQSPLIFVLLGRPRRRPAAVANTHEPLSTSAKFSHMRRVPMAR